MSTLSKCPKKSEGVASRIIDSEAVIVIPEAGLVRILNEVGSKIWQLLDGGNTIEDVINVISSEFDVSWEEARKDTLDFIRELEDRDMVVLSDEPVV